MEKLCKCNHWSGSFEQNLKEKKVKKGLQCKCYRQNHMYNSFTAPFIGKLLQQSWSQKCTKCLQDVTDMVNFIKTRTLNSRIFTIPFNEMGSDHENHIPTLRFAGYLVAKWLKALSNLKMHYGGFFPQRQLFKIC